MYIPNPQSLLTATLALTGISQKSSPIISGKILDYALPTCLDSDNNQRCTPPFTVRASQCYYLSWKTGGSIFHTTIEIRDAGSGKMIYFRDSDGEWKAVKNELVYADFRPKVWGQGNRSVEYEVRACEKGGKGEGR